MADIHTTVMIRRKALDMLQVASEGIAAALDVPALALTVRASNYDDPEFLACKNLEEVAGFVQNVAAAVSKRRIGKRRSAKR